MAAQIPWLWQSLTHFAEKSESQMSYSKLTGSSINLRMSQSAPSQEGLQWQVKGSACPVFGLMQFPFAQPGKAIHVPQSGPSLFLILRLVSAVFIVDNTS